MKIWLSSPRDHPFTALKFIQHTLAQAKLIYLTLFRVLFLFFIDRQIWCVFVWQPSTPHTPPPLCPSHSTTIKNINKQHGSWITWINEKSKIFQSVLSQAVVAQTHTVTNWACFQINKPFFHKRCSLNTHQWRLTSPNIESNRNSIKSYKCNNAVKF